jgi:hypothetical protein
MNEPYRIEVRSAIPGRGWIVWLTTAKPSRRDARRLLTAQGCQWIDSREWRVVAND